MAVWITNVPSDLMILFGAGVILAGGWYLRRCLRDGIVGAPYMLSEFDRYDRPRAFWTTIAVRAVAIAWAGATLVIMGLNGHAMPL
jgi:hypothetical protein